MEPSDTNKNTDLATAMGFPELPKDEQDKLFEEIGGVVLESTLTRFIAELDDTDVPEFEKMLDAHTAEDSMQELFTKYPRLVELFNEKIEAMHKEAAAILGETA